MAISGGLPLPPFRIFMPLGGGGAFLLSGGNINALTGFASAQRLNIGRSGVTS